MTLQVTKVVAALGRRTVLQDVDLVVPPGEVVAVVGPNGAGKSTLLRVAAGLVQPSSGSVTWDGTGLSRLSPRERAQRIGMVPQSAPLDQPFTVEEVVAMGRFAHRGRFGGAKAEDERHVEEALRRAGLEALAGRPVTELSGGERQRVLLARVLAQDPQAYLFDEPTANLDLGQAAEVARLVRSLAAEGRAVAIVMHDLEAAARLADRLVLMVAGRVHASGAPRDVVTPEHLATAFGVQAEVVWVDGQMRLRLP